MERRISTQIKYRVEEHSFIFQEMLTTHNFKGKNYDVALLQLIKIKVNY